MVGIVEYVELEDGSDGTPICNVQPEPTASQTPAGNAAPVSQVPDGNPVILEVEFDNNSNNVNRTSLLPTVQPAPVQSVSETVAAPFAQVLQPVDVNKNIVDVSMIKMPPKQGKRGRPKGAGATTAIGLSKKKQKCSVSKRVAFRQKSLTEKSKIMLSWFVDEEIVQSCHHTDMLIQSHQVKAPERISLKCLDENVAIIMIRKLFSFDAWNVVEEAVETLRVKGTWHCERCCVNLDKFDSIACDTCLNWFHLKCVGVKSRPKKNVWFCRKC